MSVVADAEREMARLVVSALNLESIDPEGIDPEAPLFGSDAASLGLDSIDALEIVLAIQQKYGVELRAADESSRQVFRSLRALSAHVQSLVDT